MNGMINVQSGRVMVVLIHESPTSPLPHIGEFCAVVLSVIVNSCSANLIVQIKINLDSRCLGYIYVFNTRKLQIIRSLLYKFSSSCLESSPWAIHFSIVDDISQARSIYKTWEDVCLLIDICGGVVIAATTAATAPINCHSVGQLLRPLTRQLYGLRFEGDGRSPDIVVGEKFRIAPNMRDQ